MTGVCHAMNGGVLPVTGFPRVSGKQGGPSKQRLTMVQTRASQTSQAFVHGGHLEVIPSKRALSEQIEFGCRGTRVEGKVVVHGVVVGSSVSRNGS